MGWVSYEYCKYNPRNSCLLFEAFALENIISFEIKWFCVNGRNMFINSKANNLLWKRLS
jgi:hypothetical protein